LSNTFPPELGTYDTFLFVDSDCTIALAASIFRNAINASPALSNARDIVAAASASPSARITAACRSCSAYSHNHQFFPRLLTQLPPTFSTINLARSASTASHLSALISAKSIEKRTLLGNLLRLDSYCEFLVREGSDFHIRR